MLNRIGRYEIQAELGRGGFGHVFRAFDPVMDSLVAIKTLIGDAEPDLLTRFRNEAAAARKLQHKNIITVYDFGEENRVPYIVMELLDGEDLERAIRSSRPFTLLQKMLIMAEVAEGLNYAHSRGVVHRDVKPANIMLLSDGNVKIMDFGIALVTQATGQRLTPQGTIMGSFRYMAPEQFEGLASDALCDIFAFGVIYYQLVTGKHPFEASEAAAVMRKIIRAEPTPIREICPACPEPLEQILHRLLQKDRDLRYRSLEEVQFDVEPILLDLQKTHAAELLQRARDLAAREQRDAAQALVKEILRFDPGNTGARDLRETLQQQSQKKLAHDRVDALLKTGQGKLEQRDFSSAIESFESALRLDRSNSDIQKLIEQARAAMGQAQRVHSLLDEAQRALDSRNLTGAINKATEALLLDPQNNNAAALLDAIRRETEARERERRLQEGLSRAKSSLMLQAFDEAVTLLQQLQPAYPESSEVAELLAKARLEKSIQAKRQRLQAGLEHGKDLLRHRHLADAVQVLEQLDREFHEITAVRDLLSYAREELATTRRKEAVTRSSEAARALLESQEFDRAIETLKEALQSYPGEESLSNLLQSAISGKAESERQKALAEAMQASQDLVAEHRYQEALERIDAFNSRHAADPALTEIRKRAQAQWDLQQRIDAMGRILGEARGLIEQGRASTATRLLHEATAQYPEDPQLAALLQLAETKLFEQKRAGAVQQAVEQAAGFTEMFQFDRAVEVVEEVLNQYPRDSALTRSLDATRLARAGHQRETEKQQAIQQARQAHREGQFAEALNAVESGLRAKAGDSDLLGLKKQIELDWDARKRIDAVQKVLGQARALLDQGRFEPAISLLEENLRNYPDDADLQSLLTRARQEHQARQRTDAVRQCVSAAEDFIRLLQFDRALEMLDQALQSYPGEQALIRVRETARSASAGRQREEARQKAIEQAAALYREGRFADALSVLDSALLVQPEDASLVATRKRVQADWELRQRHNAVEEAGAQARALVSQGHLERAMTLLEDVLRRYSDATELSSLLASVRETLRARQRDEDVRQRITEAEGLASTLHFDRALKALEKGLKSYPDEPGLLRSREAVLEARADHTREKSRLETLERIGEMHRAGRFADALRIIGAALPQYPDDPDLFAAKARMEADWETRKRNDALQQILGQVKRLLSQGHPEQAIVLIEENLRQYPDDPGLNQIFTRARQDLQAQQQAEEVRQRELALKQARHAPLVSEPPSPAVEHEVLPRPTVRWRIVLATAAALAILAGAAVAVSRYLHPRTVSFEVRTDPAGAAVRINDRSCRTPDCHFDLPPGTYRIEARLNGFRPFERSVTLDARKPVEPLVVPLEPEAPVVIERRAQPEPPVVKAPATLLVRTDQGEADVFVDGVRNGRTDRSGVLRLPLDAQEHVIRVEKKGFRTPDQQRLRMAEGSSREIFFNLPAQNVQVAQGVPEAKVVQQPAPPPTVSSTPPKPPDSSKTLEMAAMEWEQVRNSRDTAVIEAYLKKYPGGPYTSEALARIEDLVWNGVSKSDVTALRTFVAKYPGGAHSAEARLRIEKLESEAVQQIAKDREKAQQTTAEQLNRDRQGIIAALQRFSAAIETKNVDEMKAVFPNLSLADLKQYQQKDLKIEASLQLLSNPEVTGDRATAACKRAVVTTYRGRVRPPNVDRVEVNLSRNGAGWIIVSVIAR